MKIGKKIILTSLFFTLIFHVANASSFFGSISSGITDITSIIKNNLVQKIEDDFCRQYILAISDGRWASDEFRTKIGKKICTGYSGVFARNNTKLTESPVAPTHDLLNTKDPVVAQLPVNLPQQRVVNTSTPAQSAKHPSGNEVIDLTNDERTNAGLSQISEDSLLDRIAQMRVDDMFTRQYFEHTTPTGETVSGISTNAGYYYITIGENIALGNFQGAKGLVEAWMASPGHRANILNKNYTEIGVASKQGTYKGQTVTIAAQVFGRPLSDCTEPDGSVKNTILKYKSSAENLYGNMQSVKDQLSSLTSNQVQYNAKIAEYNSLAKLYNDLVSEIKQLTSGYNAQVTNFNNCVKTN